MEATSWPFFSLSPSSSGKSINHPGSFGREKHFDGFKIAVSIDQLFFIVARDKGNKYQQNIGANSFHDRFFYRFP